MRAKAWQREDRHPTSKSTSGLVARIWGAYHGVEEGGRLAEERLRAAVPWSDREQPSNTSERRLLIKMGIYDNDIGIPPASFPPPPPLSSLLLWRRRWRRRWRWSRCLHSSRIRSAPAAQFTYTCTHMHRHTHGGKQALGFPSSPRAALHKPNDAYRPSTSKRVPAKFACQT